MVWLLCVLSLCTLRAVSGASATTNYNCNGPLVSTLPHSSFQSSSQSSSSYAAHNAKLNRRDGAGGWSPLVTDQEPWLQVDLREQMEVTAVATQGRYDSWDWVSSYVLLYSDTGRGWKQYRQEDGVGIYLLLRPNDPGSLAAVLNCFSDVDSWMAQNSYNSTAPNPKSF